MAKQRSRSHHVTGNDSVDGVLLLLLGLVLLLWPQAILHVLVMVIGGAIALYGIARGVLWFKSAASTRNAVDLIVAAALLGLGVAMLAASGFFIGILNFIVGAIVAYGLVLIAMKVLRLRGGDRKQFFLALAFGVVLLVLAVLVFIRPASFGNFMIRLLGISLLVEGASMLLLKPRQ